MRSRKSSFLCMTLCGRTWKCLNIFITKIYPQAGKSTHSSQFKLKSTLQDMKNESNFEVPPYTPEPCVSCESEFKSAINIMEKCLYIYTFCMHTRHKNVCILNPLKLYTRVPWPMHAEFCWFFPDTPVYWNIRPYHPTATCSSLLKLMHTASTPTCALRNAVCMPV